MLALKIGQKRTDVCVRAGNWGFPQGIQKASAAGTCLRLQVWGHNLNAITLRMFRVYLGRMAFPGCQADRGGQVLLVPLDSW